MDKERILKQLRLVWLELRQAQADTKAIADAVKAGAITPDQAAGLLCGFELDDLLGPEESET